MNKNVFAILFLVLFLIDACVSSNVVSSNGISLSQYKYVVFGQGSDGDAELADIIMTVENKLSSKLIVVPPSKALDLLSSGAKIISPKINVKTEKWEGGHTYITVVCYDYDTNQSIAVIKSSGIGFSVGHDQQLALNAIQREIDKAFQIK